MLTDNELIAKYVEAYKEGYIDGPDAEDCSSECDDCPAGDACLQLSEGKDYTTFIRNFAPLREELETIFKEIT